MYTQSMMGMKNARKIYIENWLMPFLTMLNWKHKIFEPKLEPAKKYRHPLWLIVDVGTPAHSSLSQNSHEFWVKHICLTELFRKLLESRNQINFCQQNPDLVFFSMKKYYEVIIIVLKTITYFAVTCLLLPLFFY